MSAIIYPKSNPNDPRTAGEQYLLNVLKKSDRFHGWTVFEEPHISSMKPDFVLIHPERGVVIIEVKDWDLHSNTYESGSYIRGNKGEKIKKDPIHQVEQYKKMILKSELREAVELSEKFSNYFGAIETVVYFHHGTRQQIRDFCQPNGRYTKLWIREDVERLADGKQNIHADLYTNALSENVSQFSEGGLLQSLAEELIKYLSYSDYHLERRKPYILSPAQDKLAQIQIGSIRRWSGVAGAGKTLVLAEKAVRALKQGQRVLIVTYNITLRHYIRDLCSQQFGQEQRMLLRKNLTIIHFHELLKTIIAEHQIKHNEEERGDFTENWMRKIEDHFKNNQRKTQFYYDSILIDEGQDFKGSWLRFLKKMYTEQGELFVVYDKAQDLYQHGIWIEDSEQIKNIGFRGRPGVLKESHRIPNAMIQKIERIKSVLRIQGETILSNNQEQLGLFGFFEFDNMHASHLTEKLNQIYAYVKRLREKNKWEDITILTTNEHTGAEIVKFFKQKELKVSHVYDLERRRNQKARRSGKWSFQGGTGKLKVCSYHSYKGWETPNILLVLDHSTTDYDNRGAIRHNGFRSNNVQDALFISMSRVKAKVDTGDFYYACLNFIREYDELQKEF